MFWLRPPDHRGLGLSQGSGDALGPGKDSDDDDVDPVLLEAANARLAHMTSETQVEDPPAYQAADVFKEGGPEGLGEMGGEPPCDLLLFRMGSAQEAQRPTLLSRVALSPHSVMAAQQGLPGRGAGNLRGLLSLSLSFTLSLSLVPPPPLNSSSPALSTAHGRRYRLSIALLAVACTGLPFMHGSSCILGVTDDVDCAVAEISIKATTPASFEVSWPKRRERREEEIVRPFPGMALHPVGRSNPRSDPLSMTRQRQSRPLQDLCLRPVIVCKCPAPPGGVPPSLAASPWLRDRSGDENYDARRQSMSRPSLRSPTWRPGSSKRSSSCCRGAAEGRGARRARPWWRAPSTPTSTAGRHRGADTRLSRWGDPCAHSETVTKRLAAKGRRATGQEPRQTGA